MSPVLLETEYARLLEHARRAQHWADARDAALAVGDRGLAESCLTRYWASVRAARRHLAAAWPGLEIFARRELAARWPSPDTDRIEQALEDVRRHLSRRPPAASGIPGLYGHVRRAVRLSAATVDVTM